MCYWVQKPKSLELMNCKKRKKKNEKSRLKLCLVGGEIWMIENKGEIIGLGAIWWGEKSWRIFGKAHTFSPEPIKN